MCGFTNKYCEVMEGLLSSSELADLLGLSSVHVLGIPFFPPFFNSSRKLCKLFVVLSAQN